MKIRNLSIILVILVSLFSIDAYGQAKKPRLVVIPSDALMSQMGLLGATDDMGETNYMPNYKKAFLDTDLKACISKISELFADRGFPLTMLENELRNSNGNRHGGGMRVDVRLELNYKINKQGPRDILYFELTAVDAYSGKQVGASSGQSSPAIGETKVNLLQEAVLSHIDKYAYDIDNYFQSLATKGRESRLYIEAIDVEIPMEIEDLVDTWLQAKCVNGSFTIDEVTESYITVSQAMMPLFNEAGRGMDARRFYRGLADEIQKVMPDCKVSTRTSSKTSGSEGGGTLADGYISIQPLQ